MQPTNDDQRYLLSIAAATVSAVVESRPIPHPPPYGWPDPEPRGVFVSLHADGRLRGCVGTVRPSGPLPLMVREVAMSAARDPRFIDDGLSALELEQLHIELSVLSPMVRASDPLGSLQIGMHGIYVRTPRHSGCFLPQVAVESGWDARMFLSKCCEMKAHTFCDAWRDRDTEVYLFTTQRFGGPLQGLRPS